MHTNTMQLFAFQYVKMEGLVLRPMSASVLLDILEGIAPVSLYNNVVAFNYCIPVISNTVCFPSKS